MRPAAAGRGGPRTPTPAGGSSWSASKPTSSTSPARPACSGRPPDGRRKRSPIGWMSGARSGRPGCGSWRWTRARPTGRRWPPRCRTRVTRDTLGRRGQRVDPVWANRRRLLRGYERLSGPAFTAMWNGCIDHELTNQLLTAWIAKEELRALLACAARGGVRHDIAHRLTRFYTWCADHADIPELTTLAETVAAWWPQILNFLQLNLTNARTESTNRLIKDAARVAFGFRNLDNQRRRVRFACTRRQRLAATG